MIRKIIKIDESKCNGCGACAQACHEGAIGMVNGVAKLLRDDYCDGLGDCLPACPTGAITFEEREALAYDEEAVMSAKRAKEMNKSDDSCSGHHAGGGCPGSRMQTLKKLDSSRKEATAPVQNMESQLSQWPVQIKLLPVNAPFYNGADLLVAADCTAYAYANFHNDFIKDRITLVGCPKLDAVDYTEKLGAIIKNNDVKSVTVVRMEVPCCGGIEHAVMQAIKDSGKFIPSQVITISTKGEIL